MSNHIKSNGRDGEQTDSISVVLEAIQRSSDLAENVVRAGDDFRTAMQWNVEAGEALNTDMLGKHLPSYDKEIALYVGDIDGFAEILPTADEIAALTVIGHIPPDLTVVKFLEGETVPANETVESIIEWSDTITDNLDALYGESLFINLVLMQEGTHAPKAEEMYRKIVGLFDIVMPSRERLYNVLDYFE